MAKLRTGNREKQLKVSVRSTSSSYTAENGKHLHITVADDLNTNHVYLTEFYHWWSSNNKKTGFYRNYKHSDIPYQYFGGKRIEKK